MVILADNRTIIHTWRKGWDLNPRYRFRHAGFQDQFLKPLGHPSITEVNYTRTLDLLLGLGKYNSVNLRSSRGFKGSGSRFERRARGKYIIHQHNVRASYTAGM